MAVRPGLDPVEEGKSYSALFVLMVALLLVGAVWAIWDDNISRRPWKEYQVEFDRLAYDKYMKDAGAEQARLNSDAEYVKLTKDLVAAQAELDSGKTARHLEDLRAEAQDRQTNLRRQGTARPLHQVRVDRAMVRLQSRDPGESSPKTPLATRR